MKVPVMSVYDNMIGYGTPFTDKNEAVAIRGFRNSIYKSLEEKNIDIAIADLSLYRIGDFDTDTGVITACTPYALVHGTTCITEWNINTARCGDSEEVDEIDEC